MVVELRLLTATSSAPTMALFGTKSHSLATAKDGSAPQAEIRNWAALIPESTHSRRQPNLPGGSINGS